MTDKPELLDIRQAAALLQVSAASLRRWTNAGLLASFRVGGRRERRFRRADLLAFLESHPAAGHTAPPLGPAVRGRGCALSGRRSARRRRLLPGGRASRPRPHPRAGRAPVAVCAARPQDGATGPGAVRRLGRRAARVLAYALHGDVGRRDTAAVRGRRRVGRTPGAAERLRGAAGVRTRVRPRRGAALCRGYALPL